MPGVNYWEKFSDGIVNVTEVSSGSRWNPEIEVKECGWLWGRGLRSEVKIIIAFRSGFGAK